MHLAEVVVEQVEQAGNGSPATPGPVKCCLVEPGGAGTTSSINATPTARAGGGGGGTGGDLPTGPAGTIGPASAGGGAGGNTGVAGTAGTANTGGGGGGGGGISWCLCYRWCWW